MNIQDLDIDILNELIEKGDRFYVDDNRDPDTDKMWERDDSFWSIREPTQISLRPTT